MNSAEAGSAIILLRENAGLKTERDALAAELADMTKDRDTWHAAAIEYGHANNKFEARVKELEIENEVLRHNSAKALANHAADLTAETIPAQVQCHCVNECEEGGLRPNEYCFEDRFPADLPQDVL